MILRGLPFAVLVSFAATLAGPRAARAEDPPPDAVRESDWYGWQLLAVDGVALALWVPWAIRASTERRFESQEFAGPLAAGVISGVVISTLGTPMIHLVHHHTGRWAGSMVARILLPTLVVAVTGLSGFSCGDHDLSCHEENTMSSARWTFGTLLAVEVVDALNASDERLVVAPLRGGRGVSLAWRF